MGSLPNVQSVRWNLLKNTSFSDFFLRSGFGPSGQNPTSKKSLKKLYSQVAPNRGGSPKVRQIGQFGQFDHFGKKWLKQFGQVGLFGKFGQFDRFG